MKSSRSMRARLLNISRKEDIPFQQILYRYFHERFIYRISISAYSNAFILKGGNLLYVKQGLFSRPTKDIDFLAKGLTNNSADIKNVFVEICKVECQNDKVLFDSASLDIMVISDQEKNSGLRVVLTASFDTSKQKIQIDIAFGDKVVPAAQTIDYPVLLNEMPVPVIMAYTIETVIAEKFHAMIELAGINSRMKDFYDVYSLLKDGKYEEKVLQESISATFYNRKTFYTEKHILFTDDFAQDKNRNVMWNAFLKKIASKDSYAFPEVIGTIKDKLFLFYLNIKKE